MNPRIDQLIADCDGRYLQPDEQRQLLSYFNTLPQRLRVAEMVEKVEQGVCKHMVDEMKKLYPNFDRYHDFAWGKAFRDVQIVIRHNVQAMLCDDVQTQNERMMYWFRTILASFDLTPKFNEDCYTVVRDEFRRRLPPETYEVMEPYLQANIDVMKDIPEPARPRV